MGAPKQKWTSEEEEALRAGVEKHGVGKWRTIQKDPEFSHCLATRSNIDLKDKWRNMIVFFGGPSREKSRTPKLKALPPIPGSSSPGNAALVPANNDEVNNDEVSPATDSMKKSKDGKAPGYSALIIEALASLKVPNGSEIEVGAIRSYIEQRYEVPPHFRRLLTNKLRRLQHQHKIEKGQKGYKLKETTCAPNTPTPKQHVTHRSRPLQSPDDYVEASDTIAYKIAEAEAKSFLASEAVKEAEKILSMQEEAESLLLLAEEIYERCKRGEIVSVA